MQQHILHWSNLPTLFKLPKVRLVVPKLGLLLLAFSISQMPVNAQASHEKKTLVQGFWWDYWNDNFPNSWANYLTELAPRLKDMGVDAVWIPPTIKNQDFGGIKGVGYAPYDHYDLGDKMQKNDATTRVGTKDELLRMIAVMHANGIEVIQDIVPNHVIGAGSDTGGGGQDPSAPPDPCTDAWKNFRYACYETPATDQSAADYLARKGRFPKNHQNFHPNPRHSCGLCDINGDPICWQGFGPDVCFADGAAGLSGNAIYNPNQNTYSPYGNGGTGVDNGYMRKHFREWLIWYKKQTGFDGVRIDAVKHFTAAASEDFLYNLQQTASFASGGDEMFAVGEWVGNSTAMDNWVSTVQNRSGTFDFNLRAFDASGGLYSMIYGNGGYDMGSLPGAQQGKRYIDINNKRIHRTVPFVNNHDTYRPQLDSIGNIVGWNTGDELSPHIEMNEPRLAAAYAVACAMDGNPQIFFEDLFNVANTSKRFSHLPDNTTDLPVNSDIANIILSHGALGFKEGSYTVPSNVPTFWNNLTSSDNNDDIIVIERTGKAIIAATDNWGTDQDVWVDTQFPIGTVLKDYSGGFTTTTTVLGPSGGGTSNRVNIKVRGVGYPDYAYSTSYADHGAHYHGYAIWAPEGQSLNSYSNAPITTIQEWEMDDDLGDSHCESLGQGGRTPDHSPNARVVGKIFSEANTAVGYDVYLGSPGTSLTVDFYDLDGNLLHSNNDTSAVMDSSFVNTITRWITIKVRNTSDTTSGQKCWVKLTYTAPASVTTSLYPSATNVSIWTSNGGSSDWDDCHNWEEGLVPTCSSTVIIPHPVKHMPCIGTCFTGLFENRVGLTLKGKAFLEGPYDDGLMSDGLRVSGLIPALTPYVGTDTLEVGALTVSGDDAVVDWVIIELRDKNDSASVLHTRSALIQRDGDVVGTDGMSPLYFNGVTYDDYFLAIKHRNHFGAMTALATNLDAGISTFDFSDNNNVTWGANAQKDLGSGILGLYAADINSDGLIDATDRHVVWNERDTSGYVSSDVNLDGQVDVLDRLLVWINRNVIMQLP